MPARLGRALHLPPCAHARYGWFWECPNGGDKCQYRHALPAGYVLKSEVKDTEDNTEQLEDRIERERRALTTRTPVTLDRLQGWLKNKQQRKAEQEAAAMSAAAEEKAAAVSAATKEKAAAVSAAAKEKAATVSAAADGTQLTPARED